MRKVLLVGSGRLAQHLIFWNSLSKQPDSLILWNRKQNSFDELQASIEKVEIILLAISDSALLSFYEQHLKFFNGKIVHFSGAIQNEKLITAHPLMSFPAKLMDSSVYAKIHFILTGIDDLADILPAFKNSFSVLNAKDKAFYHSLCVIAGNFPQLLWSEVAPEFQKLNVPNHAVDAYLEQITTNFVQLKNQSLTGPLIRKDMTTIDLNIKALQNSKLQYIYESFVEVFTK